MNSQTINLSLTTQEINTVLSVLGKVPYENVHQLIHKLQYQASEQLKVTEEPVLEEESH